MFVIGKCLAMLMSTQMIPVCLDGDSVAVKGVPALLLADSRLLPSPHPVSPGYLSLSLCVCYMAWVSPNYLLSCGTAPPRDTARVQSVCPTLAVRVLTKLGVCCSPPCTLTPWLLEDCHLFCDFFLVFFFLYEKAQKPTSA